MLRQRHHREQEASCFAAVIVDGCAKCSYSRYVGYTPTQLIIAVRNDVRIIDVRLTTLVLLLLVYDVGFV